MTSQQSLFATDSDPISASERRNKCFVKPTDVESLLYYDEQGSPLYIGEMLDVKSRSLVRRTITGKMKGEWAGYWSGISKLNRIVLVKQIIYKLNEKGFNDDKYADTCCYSPQAVAEEIDFFLPKSFWSVKVRKSGSASQTYIDPDWPSFEKWGWNFEYSETRTRLKAERESTLSRFSENHRKKVERDRLKGSSESNLPKFDPETGEILEEEKQ